MKNLILIVCVILSSSLFAKGKVSEKKDAVIESKEVKETPHADEQVLTESKQETKSRKHAVYGELLGRAVIMSVGYDYQFANRWAVGAGLSYWNIKVSGASIKFLIVPVYTNYYFNTDDHRAYLTGGVDLVTASASNSTGTIKGSGVSAVVGAGYELRKAFLFRTGPYFIASRGGKSLWLGASFGAAF